MCCSATPRARRQDSVPASFSLVSTIALMYSKSFSVLTIGLGLSSACYLFSYRIDNCRDDAHVDMAKNKSLKIRNSILSSYRAREVG